MKEISEPVGTTDETHGVSLAAHYDILWLASSSDAAAQDAAAHDTFLITGGHELSKRSTERDGKINTCTHEKRQHGAAEMCRDDRGAPRGWVCTVLPEQGPMVTSVWPLPSPGSVD